MLVLFVEQFYGQHLTKSDTITAFNFVVVGIKNCKSYTCRCPTAQFSIF